MVNTHDLVEADFRKIQKLLVKKHRREYTLDYIRKVCKGKRNNDFIYELAEKYVEILNEMEKKINLLVNDLS